MAEQVTLAATTRRETGKGAARTLRREGKVPAVIYGHGREPEALVLDAMLLKRQLANATSNTVVEVTVEGRPPVKALIREVQRNPLKPGSMLHLDLYEIHAGEKITVSVPLHFEGIPDGVRNFGGVFDHPVREIELKVLPSDIPDRITVDVTELAIGDSIHVRDLSVPNAEILDDDDLTICTVVAPRVEEVAPVAEAEVETAEPELIRKPKAEDEAEEA